jgi:hypothetical protein
MCDILSDLKMYFEYNYINVAESLFNNLNLAVKGINDYLFMGTMLAEFVKAQGFTQVSSALGNSRNSFWKSYLCNCGFNTKFNSKSDLKILGLEKNYNEGAFLCETKGSGTCGSCYVDWRGGKKYREFKEPRLFFLSQEIYDVEKICLKQMRMVIANASSKDFIDTDINNKTNITVLRYKNLKRSGSILFEHEIIKD